MSQQDSNKNKIITYLAIAIGIAFMIFTISLWTRFSTNEVTPTEGGAGLKSNLVENKSGNGAIGDYERELNKTAAEINSTCPIMINMDTRLDNVMAFILSNEFQYNYTLINTEKDLIDVQSLENMMRPSVLAVMKTSPELDVFRDNNTTLIYHYSDKNAIPLFKLTFHSSEFGN